MAARRGAKGREGRGKGEEIAFCAVRHQTAQANHSSRSVDSFARAATIFLDFVEYASSFNAAAAEAVIDSSRRRDAAFDRISLSRRSCRSGLSTRANQFCTVLCVNITCWFKCSEILLVGNQMVVLEEGGMLTTGHNQYLPPDYLSPLPTTVSIAYSFLVYALCYKLELYRQRM